MNKSNNDEPCLVNAKQGFSVLYQNRALYSKYIPFANIEKIINDTTILPDTFIILISPVLDYGIKLLLSKIPENCILFAIETDKKIFDFTLKNNLLLNKLIKEEQIDYKLTTNYKEFSNCFTKLFLSNKKTKRVLFISFSSISETSKLLLNKYSIFATSYISQFWKNQVTLLKLGKLYAKNLFENLSLLPNNKVFQLKTLLTPIFVVGAGPSLNNDLSIIKQYSDKAFIICVDSSISTLNDYLIKPDIVIAVESQLANEKAFIGNTKSAFLFISDLTSRNNINQIFKNNISFIFTNYAKLNYLARIKDLLSNNIPEIEPLGSVGLYALKIATLLRKNNSIPIFFSGLDFSYSIENSHCMNAPASKNKLLNTNRLHSLISPKSVIKYGIKQLSNNLFTDIPLSGYASLLEDVFSNEKQIFSLSQNILFQKIPSINEISLQQIFTLSDNNQTKTITNFLNNPKKEIITKSKIKTFFENELSSLQKIRNSLCSKNTNLSELIKDINEHDYLFAHFPDSANGASKDISFLKRISSELDYFIKIITNCLKNM